MKAFAFLFVLLPICVQAEVSKTVFSSPDSKNQILKFTDKGISPNPLHMKVDDSIVFFLNDTKSALTTMEIDYHGKHTHCSSSNLKIVEENGTVRSTRPFGPRDFATACFHDKGSFPVTVYGLPSNPNGAKGTIIVE